MAAQTKQTERKAYNTSDYIYIYGIPGTYTNKGISNLAISRYSTQNKPVREIRDLYFNLDRLVPV